MEKLNAYYFRIFKAIFTLFILGLVYSSSDIAASEMTSEVLCINKYKANLRSGPGSHHNLLKSLSLYTPLKKIEKTGHWYHVQANTVKGFIHESLVTDNYECLQILARTSFYCHHSENFRRPLKYGEPMKIIKKEIGCNYVQDTRGKKFWIKSINIWPKEMAKRLSL